MAFAFKLRRSLTNSSITSIPSDSVEAYKIPLIKEKLMKELENCKEQYAESDVKILSTSNYVRRFMERQKGDVDKTVEMMVKVLKFRFGCGLHLYDDLFIPVEFYKIGAAFIYSEDVDGNPCLYVRAKFHRRIPEMKLPMENFLAYLMFKVDHVAAEKGSQYGWTLIFDVDGVTMLQYDLPELMFLIRILVDYTPNGLKRLIVYNVPWCFKHLVKLVMSFTPDDWRDRIFVLRKEEIFKHIPLENAPKYMGGLNEKSFRVVPEGAKTVKEIAAENYDRFKVSPERVEKILKIYEKLFTQE